MISVVVPLYNKEKSITKCIESVLRQSYREIEIIVVNDGSTDMSLNRVNSLTDERIKVFSYSNSGVSKARNIGISQSSGDYIAFLDADDYWEKDYLLEMMDVITANPDCALFGARQYIVSSGQISLSRIGRLNKNRLLITDDYFKYAKDAILFHASGIIVNKKFIVDNGLRFDERLKFGEDLDFYFSIALRSKVAFNPKPLTYYSLIAENRAMSRKKAFDERLIGNLPKYAKYYACNPSFRDFLNKYLMSCWLLLLREKASVTEIASMLSIIDPRSLSVVLRAFFYLPLPMKKMLVLFRR